MPERTPRGTALETRGHGDAAVVLVHGLGLNRQSWQWQAPALAERYRVITYDLHGHGESSLPPERPSLAMFSDQLRELMDHLRLYEAAVLGFSLGGMIARRFAMDNPDRLWALGVLHSAHARDTAAQDAILRRVEQARAEGPAATVEAALQRWFTDDFRAANPALMNTVRGWIMANRREVYWPIYQVLADGVSELIAPSPPINVPTLVMTGDEDHGNSPAMSRAIAAEIPGADLVILPGLRHMALAEAPDTFNAQLLGFLERASGRTLKV
ncbi:MAG: alpha/beta fold hydrolase [Aestuariivirga sp.]|uniref:alpha/beta fold hydrolase n=1 Tax=Aestuariivirga sp. TaxID=2650926 RepID=UPI0038D24A77